MTNAYTDNTGDALLQRQPISLAQEFLISCFNGGLSNCVSCKIYGRSAYLLNTPPYMCSIVQCVE
eukprot:188780-Karenia_brevis.AAC.1